MKSNTKLAAIAREKEQGLLAQDKMNSANAGVRHPIRYKGDIFIHAGSLFSG